LHLAPGLPESHAFNMSVQEIIAELPKLKLEDSRLVKAKVDALARAHRRTIGDGSVLQRHPRPIPFEQLSARRRQQCTANSARAANTGKIVLTGRAMKRKPLTFPGKLQ
jgi:hypothetical protein